MLVVRSPTPGILLLLCPPHASVTVVIPTRHRPGLLARALTSVYQQETPAAQVVVVIDGPDDETARTLQSHPDVTVVQRATSGGPAAARNDGVRAATSQFVAFLDDDDVWRPGKLTAQVELLSRTDAPEHLVVSSVAVWRTEVGQELWPVRPPRSGEPVADYLFVRSVPGEGMLATPTIILARDLALAVPMPEHLHLHEDFDWFLSLEDAGARFEVVMEPLVEVTAEARRTSASRSAQWRDSFSWAQARRERLGSRAYSAFLLTQVARLATGSGLRPALCVLRHALTGSPRARDIARFVLIVLLPERLRWRIGGYLGRVRS